MYFIVSSPVVTPSTTPVVDIKPSPFVAVHKPPLTESVRVMLLPVHTDEGPVTVPAFGNGLTVIKNDAAALPQMLVTVYIMLSVPAETPDTIPDVPTVAMPAVTLLQVPPDNVSVSVIALSAHTVCRPVIAPATGNGFTVIG